MAELTTAWMLGCTCGFFIGVTVAGRRRPTCRELMRDADRRPSFAELLMPPPRTTTPVPLFTAEEVARIVAPTVKKSLTDPSGSLVERVAWLIAKRFSESRPGTDCLPFGRDVILEVAAWLRSEYPRREGYGTAWANLIEQEASR
jgi:hypothetical protein